MENKASENQVLLAFIELSPILIPYALGFFVYRGLYAVFPLYLQLKVGYTEFEVVNLWAIISTVALFMGAVTRIPAGLISDKIGRIPALIFGYLNYTIAVLALIFFPGELTYLFSITLIRMSLNLYTMSGRGIVSNSEREKGFKNGLLSSMVGFGSLLGPFLLSLSLDNYEPDFILIIVAVFIGVDMISFLLVLKFMPFVFSKISNDQIELPLRPIIKKNMKYRSHFNYDIIKSITLFFSAGLIYGLITVIFTIYAYNVLDMSITFLGLVVGLGSLLNMIISPITGLLYMKFVDENMRRIAWFTVCISTYMITLGQVNQWIFITGYILLSGANAMFITVEITRLGRVVEKDAFSFIFGMASTFIIFGGAIASFITNFLYEIHQEATFYTAFGIALVTFAFVLFSRKAQYIE